MRRSNSRARGSVLDNVTFADNALAQLADLERRIRVLEERLGGSGGGSSSTVYQIVDIDTTPLSFGDGDTTPSVSEGDHNQLYICGNTASTSVTDFDDGAEGQFIEILFTTGNTTLVDGSGINLHGSTNYNAPANTIMGFRYYSGGWYEKTRRNP